MRWVEGDVRAADTVRERKQAQQKNRVDVAGVLGAGSGGDIRGALPIPDPAPPPTPVQVGAATQQLVSLGAAKPDGYTGGARQNRATPQLEGANKRARKHKQRKRRRNRRQQAEQRQQPRPGPG